MKVVSCLVGVMVFSSIASAEDDFFAGTIKYMDNLKTCTAYTFSYKHPIIPNFVGQNVIKARKDDKCQVTIVMPGNRKMECELTAETVRLMTSEDKYREARAKTMSGSSSDPVSRKMNEECRISKQE